MRASLCQQSLAKYLTHQLETFYPDGVRVVAAIKKAVPSALIRLEVALRSIKSPGSFSRKNEPYFDHLFGDQYAMFLYLVSNELGPRLGESNAATKVYLLNKALHGIDVYFEVRLPEIFLFAHPLGTVLGRAKYGDYLLVMQNCTVGNIKGRYPTIGNGCVLCAGAGVLGGCVLEDGVTIAAGSLAVNVNIPANHVFIGRGSQHRVVPSEKPMWTNYFEKFPSQ